VALQTARVFPTFNAMVAASAIPVATDVVRMTLADVTIIVRNELPFVYDRCITVKTWHLTVMRLPTNPILFARSAACGDRVLRLATCAVLHNLAIAVIINDSGVIKTIFTDALRDFLSVEKDAVATKRAHFVFSVDRIIVCIWNHADCAHKL
jgi:hypothetical protein